MEQSLCELPFTLHRQQPEKYKQNFDFASHGKGFWFILTKVCRSLLCAILLNGASASSG